MKIKIKETGEIKELTLMDWVTEVDYVVDFILSNDADQTITHEEVDLYVTDMESFEWWEKVVSDQQDLDDRIATLKYMDNIDCEELQDIIRDAAQVDLEDLAWAVNQALDEFLAANA